MGFEQYASIIPAYNRFNLHERKGFTFRNKSFSFYRKYLQNSQPETNCKFHKSLLFKEIFEQMNPFFSDLFCSHNISVDIFYNLSRVKRFFYMKTKEGLQIKRQMQGL